MTENEIRKIVLEMIQQVLSDIYWNQSPENIQADISSVCWKISKDIDLKIIEDNKERL